MPTELYINPKDNSSSRPHVIRPGAKAVFHDYTDGKDKAIGVYCAEDDSRTDVYTHEQALLPRIKLRKVKNIDDPLFFRGNREASVFSGQELPLTLMDNRGRLVRLIIKHARTQYPEGQGPEEFAA